MNQISQSKFAALQAKIAADKNPKVETQFYHTHQLADLNISDLIRDIKNDGVVVIEDIYTKAECDEFMDQSLACFEKLGTGINFSSQGPKNLYKTWTKSNLPRQTRFGLYQSVMGHIPPVWEIRQDPKIRKIFAQIYQNVRSDLGSDFSEEKLAVSIDGINIQPNNLGPLHKFDQYDSDKIDPDDWAHLDQTVSNHPFQCLQGSVSLTNTTAGFRCSPKSHLLHDEILKMHGISENESFETADNWLRLKKSLLPEIKRKIENLPGGKFQIPVITKPGSLILWFSSLLHSAVNKTKYEQATSQDKYLGWRGVFYICHRPISDLSERQKLKMMENTKKNLNMNHWSDKTFGTQKFGPDAKNSHPKIQILMNHPEKFFEMIDFYPKHPLEQEYE